MTTRVYNTSKEPITVDLKNGDGSVSKAVVNPGSVKIGDDQEVATKHKNILVRKVEERPAEGNYTEVDAAEKQRAVPQIEKRPDRAAQGLEATVGIGETEGSDLKEHLEDQAHKASNAKSLTGRK